jgi:phage regulator Rha-like protein
MNQTLTERTIANRIYRIRGQQIMLDSDLATLYGVRTKNLNKAVHRNTERFPTDFMFRLSKSEYETLRFQSGTLKRGQHTKYLPYAFTQEGIAMLSSVLRSPRSIQVNVAIMRAFVKLRHAVLAHQGIARRVEKLEGKVDVHETDIRLIVKDIHDIKKTSSEIEQQPKRIKGFFED